MINTFFGFGIIFILVYLGVIAEISNVIGYIFGFFLSYFLNKSYNFKSQKRHRDELPKFLLSMGISYILNLITLVVLYRFLDVNVYMSQLFAGAVYTLSGYFFAKRWVFHNE